MSGIQISDDGRLTLFWPLFQDNLGSIQLIHCIDSNKSFPASWKYKNGLIKLYFKCIIYGMLAYIYIGILVLQTEVNVILLSVYCSLYQFDMSIYRLFWFWLYDQYSQGTLSVLGVTCNICILKYKKQLPFTAYYKNMGFFHCCRPGVQCLMLT